MLETIAIILIVLWLLGMVSGYTLGQLHLRSAGHRDRAVPGAADQRPDGFEQYAPETGVIGGKVPVPPVVLHVTAHLVQRRVEVVDRTKR